MGVAWPITPFSHHNPGPQVMTRSHKIPFSSDDVRRAFKVISSDLPECPKGNIQKDGLEKMLVRWREGGRGGRKGGERVQQWRERREGRNGGRCFWRRLAVMCLSLSSLCSALSLARAPLQQLKYCSHKVPEDEILRLLGTWEANDKGLIDWEEKIKLIMK